MAIRRPCGISFLIVKYPVPIRCVAQRQAVTDDDVGMQFSRFNIFEEFG